METPEAKQGWWQRKTGEKLKISEKIGLFVLVIVFLFVFYITLDANKYEARVRTIEGEGRVGVNPTTERLDFGDLSRGTSAVRTVTVENNTKVPFFVAAVKVGGIRSIMKADDATFMLREDEERQISFTTFMPASAEINRIYKGRIFVFKVPAPFF